MSIRYTFYTLPTNPIFRHNNLHGSQNSDTVPCRPVKKNAQKQKSNKKETKIMIKQFLRRTVDNDTNSSKNQKNKKKKKERKEKQNNEKIKCNKQIKYINLDQTQHTRHCNLE